jgi:hypothetical protein
VVGRDWVVTVILTLSLVEMVSMAELSIFLVFIEEKEEDDDDDDQPVVVGGGVILPKYLNREFSGMTLVVTGGVTGKQKDV